MKKLYSIMLLAFTISNIYAGTITKTVNVTTPGTLTNLLTTDEKISILNLTVTGNIDARDFVCIRDEVRNITVLDLRNSNIKEYNGVWGTDIIDFITFYPENEIPRRSFSGLSRYYDAKYNYILKTVYLPNSATSIGSYAFYQCPELTDVIIGNSVTSIKDYAFRWSSKLKSISIPQSVSTIGFGSFMDNSGLTEIKVNTNNQYFSSIDGVLFNKNQTKLISYPSGKLGTYIIPNTVKVIDWLAFFRCLKITDVIFPNSLDSIQGGAFEECYNLNSILNLTSVSFIGTQAFMRTGIKSVITGNKLKKIQSSTFKYCTSLKKVRLGNSIVEIENDAFANCPQLTTINIPNSVRKIGSWEAPNVTIINSAFGESGLTSCVIPSSVDTIGSSTYKSCFDLWTVYNYRSTPYERCPFSFLSGRNYTLYVPEGTSNKYKSANDWNKFTNIIEMTTTKVINISIAGTLKTYFNTNELKTINKLTIAGNIDARDIRFIRDEIPMLEFLDISGTNIQEYYGNEGTNNTIMSYPSNELPSNSFENFNDTSLIYNLDLINIKLPNTIISIGKKAFAFCGGLRSISIPSTVTTIKDSVFYECNHLYRLICMNITPPVISDEILLSCPISTIFVPKGRTETYKTSTIWGSIPNILEYKLKVSTTPVSSIKLKSVTLNGNIDLITNKNLINHGFCWNTTGLPTIDDNKLEKGVTEREGVFSDSIFNLEQSTIYYVRAFATDDEGIAYGEEVKFTTQSVPNTPSQIIGLSNICPNEKNVTYSIQSIPNATKYTWTLPNGDVETSSINSIVVNYFDNSTSGYLSVFATNEWGDGAASSLAINVNQLPLSAGQISGNTSVCQGENSVSYTVPIIENATSYIWTLPTGASGTSITNSINVNYGINAVSGNITVKGHNECGDGAVTTIPITVNQLPLINVIDKTVICGGSVSLNATTNYSGSGTISYQWSPTTGLNDATIANPTATVNNDITYTVTINTPNSCSASKSLSVTIIPMVKPEIGMVSVNSDNKNLIAWNKPVSIGIESYYIYRETNVTNVYEKIGTVPYDSLSIYVDTQSLPDVQSNKYRLSIQDRHGLESPQSNYHKTMHLAINKGLGTTWNLSWEAYEGFIVSTYNIYRGTTPTNLTLLGSTSGSNTQYNDLNAPTGDVYYQLEVISPNSVNPTKVLSSQKTKADENGFSNSQISYSSSRSNIATNVTSAINELGENNKIYIYPNPVKNELRIDFEGGSTFEILNLIGQVVYNGNLEKSKIVRTSNLSSGVYLIKFKAGKSFDFKKIIKE